MEVGVMLVPALGVTHSLCSLSLCNSLHIRLLYIKWLPHPTVHDDSNRILDYSLTFTPPKSI